MQSHTIPIPSNELKTKFQATVALTNPFPNGTIFMEQVLNENVDVNSEPNPLTINDYFMMDEADKEMWEKKGNLLNETLIFLSNSKNNTMKKDLRLVYLHGNKSCYPYDPEAMARLYHSQYRIYPKRAGTDPNRDTRNRNGNGSDDESTTNRNQENANTETPGGTIGAHIEPNSNPNDEPMTMEIVTNMRGRMDRIMIIIITEVVLV